MKSNKSLFKDTIDCFSYFKDVFFLFFNKNIQKSFQVFVFQIDKLLFKFFNYLFVLSLFTKKYVLVACSKNILS